MLPDPHNYREHRFSIYTLPLACSDWHGGIASLPVDPYSWQPCHWHALAGMGVMPVLPADLISWQPCQWLGPAGKRILSLCQWHPVVGIMWLGLAVCDIQAIFVYLMFFRIWSILINTIFRECFYCFLLLFCFGKENTHSPCHFCEEQFGISLTLDLPAICQSLYFIFFLIFLFFPFPTAEDSSWPIL